MAAVQKQHKEAIEAIQLTDEQVKEACYEWKLRQSKMEGVKETVQLTK